MKDAVALYIGKGNALVFGEKRYLSEDRKVAPYRKNNSVMVPFHLLRDTMGEVGTEPVCGCRKCLINGKMINMSELPEQGAGNVLYVPLQDYCDVLGWHIHEEENGIVIYSRYDMEDVLNWTDNMNFMRRLIESYVYDDVDGETMFRMLIKKHPEHHHPRLILTQEKIQEMRREILSEDGDAVYKKIYRNLKFYGERYLEERTSGYEIRDGVRLLYVCRENNYRMLTCALMYLITEEEVAG